MQVISWIISGNRGQWGQEVACKEFSSGDICHCFRYNLATFLKPYLSRMKINESHFSQIHISFAAITQRQKSREPFGRSSSNVDIWLAEWRKCPVHYQKWLATNTLQPFTNGNTTNAGTFKYGCDKILVIYLFSVFFTPLWRRAHCQAQFVLLLLSLPADAILKGSYA